MKRLILYVIILIIAIIVGLWLIRDNGYVMFSYGSWTIELTAWSFVILAIIVFVILYFAINMARGLSRAPRHIRNWRKSKRSTKAHSLTSDGVLALHEGNWKEAEYLLVRGVESSAIPVVNYLSAARAAQEMLAYDRRDEYLRRAQRVDKSEVVAVGITKVKLQLEHHQLDLAKDTLVKLKKLAPKHPYVKKLIFELHVATKNWQRQLELLPTIRKLKIIDEEELDHQEYLAVRHLFQDENKRLDDINAMWLALPKAMRNRRRIVKAYTQALIRLGAYENASDVLINALKNEWHDDLLELYAQVQTDRPMKQLEVVEGWLKKQSASPVLYYTASMIALHAESWALAKTYAEKSIQLEKTPQAYSALAMAADKLGEQALVTSALRTGLALRCKQD